MFKEIERKFKVKDYPKLIASDSLLIEQSYLSINPEVRLRKITKLLGDSISYTMEVKGDGDLTRIEVCKELSEGEYNTLLTMVEHRPVLKVVKVYQVGEGLITTCNAVDTHLQSNFMYTEVEFKDEDSANAFIPPSWFGEEITYAKQYKMKNYWKRTRINTKELPML